MAKPNNHQMTSQSEGAAVQVLRASTHKAVLYPLKRERAGVVMPHLSPLTDRSRDFPVSTECESD